MTKILDSFWVESKNHVAVSFQDENFDVKVGDMVTIDYGFTVKVLGIETFMTADIDYNNRQPRALLLDGFAKGANLMGCVMEIYKND